MTPAEQFIIDKLGAWPFGLLWGAWLIYWFISSRNAKRNASVETRASHLSHTIPPIIGLIVIEATQPPNGFITPILWPFGVATYVGSFLMIALGLSFTVWARVHLGTNWSLSVARKQSSELIRTGPYGWVRHPIYAGLLFAFLGIALGRGDLGALIGCALLIYGLLRKLNIEERWLRQTFGQAYATYSTEVSSLLPWPTPTRHH